MRRKRSSVLVMGMFLLTVGCAVAGCAVAAQNQQAPIGAQTGDTTAGRAGTSSASFLTWRQALAQPDSWYGSDEAVRIADNVLLYQRDTGGWHKNLDMAKPLTESEKAKITDEKKDTESTIDNGATTQQMYYLARVYTATKQERFKDAFLKGVDYLLAAQYPNGGWPQYYPLRKGYYTHITYNDGAMMLTMNLLRDISRKEPIYAFVDQARRARAERAIQKGLDCILKTQVVVNGQRTVWCAQHDEKTLLPVQARTFEPPSLASTESIGIARYLMKLDRPGPEVKEAIQAAIAWFEAAKLTGIRYEEITGPAAEGGRDRIVVKDPAAPPTWARFYEISTNRPIFSGRDGVVKYSLAEIERERRAGYRWYSSAASVLLEKDYPAWRDKWLSNNNDLQSSPAKSASKK
jgi:PelA/Pel-15E family pectate lyase